ncbi:MAG: DegT/DnrJ/EryC1/StrS aminotransferase family protein [Chitinophagaceae bacterium]|nr:DegT/DnrJ/EryC1/StrS aminotransferase family protein [Bacteroidota bacterium]MCC6256844.1 DegT/DnrJ/EryC1/StrS aminotransferase family protein [Chitinophagaceae bacterium]MCW5916976.1 DegT/DnrJ/EryC1/StrS aminotransferase family protein [Ferruginibacter sp.]
MSKIAIPIYQPDLSGNEKKYVLDCLDSTWISSKGKYIHLFEEKFADYISVKHAAGVCNGTVAIHLALLALGIGPGDEVIVPTLTYIASVNAISYVGATPVFCDSLKSNWQMDPDDVKRKVTPKTRAVLAVHLYGHPCDMDRLTQICGEHQLFLIEDCAEAIGSKFKGKHVGTFGDISTFSFFGNKTITTGEGGMVVTHDETLIERARHFRGQGLAQHREYWHDVIGYNFRMTNIEAALGLAQLERVEHFLAAKKQIADWYQSFLDAGKVTFHNEVGDVTHSHWMCSILVNDPAQREPLRNHLALQGIETRPLFYPIHTMPMYAQKFQKHDVAENLGWRGINLPSFPGLTKEQVMYISQHINSYL